MPENKQYGIAEVLSEALEAAVFADISAANKAYSIIEKYAYGIDPDEASANPDGQDDERGSMRGASANPDGQGDENSSMKKTLDMAVFTIYGSDGTPHEVSIPKISMIPLPLLHITEASFEIEMTATVEPLKGTEGHMNPDDASSGASASETTITRPTVTQPSRPSASETTITRPSNTRPVASQTSEQPASNTGTSQQPTPSNSRARPSRSVSDNVTNQRPASSNTQNSRLISRRVTTSLQRRETLLKDIKPISASTTNQQMVIGSNVKDSSSDKNTSTINMKVKLEMKQAELPEGIKLLLQTAAHSLQVTADNADK